MSTYTVAEAALLTLVRAYSAGSVFTTSTSALDDWTLIDTVDTSAIIEMGADTAEAWDLEGRGSQGGVSIERHVIDLWLCKKRSAGATGDAALKQSLKTLAGALLDYLRPYEKLNAASGVAKVIYTGTTTPAYLSRTRSVADASHMAQRIRATVYAEVLYVPHEEGY